MLGGIPEGEADRLTRRERVQVLSCEFEIRTNSDELTSRLAYVAQRADQSAIPTVHHCRIDVIWTGEEYKIIDHEFGEDFELSLGSTIEFLFRRMHLRAFEGMPDHFRIHAASGLHNDRIFLIVGPKRSGKTTLALRLLSDAFEMVGDELVLIKEARGVTFPRKFYVRETAIDLLSSFNFSPGLPFVRNPSEGRLIAVDPTQFGKPWRIRSAEISTILFLEPNHGGRTSVVRSSKIDMVRRVMSECVPPVSSRPDWIADLARTVDGADAFVLRIGELDTAVTALRTVLDIGRHTSKG